jgi:hypothetical protein
MATHEAIIEKIILAFSSRYLGSIGRLPGHGLSLFHAHRVLTTGSREHRQMLDRLAIPAEPLGIVCLVTEAPARASRIYLCGEPQEFPRRYAGLTVRYVLAPT